MLLFGKDYLERENDRQELLPPPLADTETDADKSPDDERKKWYQKTLCFLRKNRKGSVVAAAVALIGLAVYLNWYLYRAQVPVENEQGIDAQQTQQNTGGDAAESDYFAVSLINRQRARDEAIAVLETIAQGASEESKEREDALAQISSIAQDIEREAAIETLIKSKGFSDCVAVISGGGASVVVKSSGLLENEIAQIQEIVYDTTGILPANLKIIER